MEGRLKVIERKLERKEREERRRNLIIRGIEVEERKRKETVEKIMKAMGVEKVKIEKIWEIV